MLKKLFFILCFALMIAPMAIAQDSTATAEGPKDSVAVLDPDTASVVATAADAPIVPTVASPDPSGASTGSAASVTAAEPGKPTLEELANEVGHSKVAMNFVWIMLCAFLVMFMQTGFAMVEGGLTRAKNAAHTFSMNFLIYPLGMIGFYICGFALMFGGVGTLGTLGGYNGLDSEFTITLFGKTFGLFGMEGFFLNGHYDVAVFTLFIFQMVFMDTTATIPTGSMAERWKYSAFFVYGLVVSTIIYPIYGNWVWGAGWLSQLGANFGFGHGHLDFAGSSVVHLTGGVLALIGAKIIGPRIGKREKILQGYSL